MTIKLTDRELLESVRASPAGREIIAQREAALMDERRQQAAEFIRVRRELADGLPSHDAAVEKAKRRQEEAHAARVKALEACGTAQRERAIFASGLTQRIETLEVELRRTAPREIAEFIGGQVLVNQPSAGPPGVVLTRAEAVGLEAELRRTQDAPLTEWRHPTKGVWKNNQAQISARVTAIRAAQAKAALLMLEALTPEEVAERLQAIQAEIPSL